MEFVFLLVGILIAAVVLLAYRAWRGRVAVKLQKQDAAEYVPHEFWD